MLYEGTPDYPGPDRLWKICSDHRVTHLGIAPTAIRALMAHGDEHPRKHDLSALRVLGSSGEAWNTEPWKWFLARVGGGRCPIINYSGGTEIGGGIVGCFPTLPLVPNCFHGPVPGMVADVFGPDGTPVRGAVGELVVKAPWIGMTQSFWGGDPQTRDDGRYLAAYWDRFPDTWVHGDWCEIEPEAGFDFWFIRGRSDDTINVAGKRVGPAEFESAIVTHAAVKEAAAIAIPDEVKGDVVVALVVLRDPAAAIGRVARRTLRGRRPRDGKVVASQSDLLRRRSAAHAQPQGDASRRPRPLPEPARLGRPLRAREPASPRRDRRPAVAPPPASLRRRSRACRR